MHSAAVSSQSSSSSSSSRSSVFTGSYKLLFLAALLSVCSVLGVIAVSSVILLRRRARRQLTAASRDPEMTSHTKMAPLCSNGKVSTIDTSENHDSSRQVRLSLARRDLTDRPCSSASIISR